MKNCLEIWKPVVGFESIYEVSNFGNVRVIKTKKLRKLQLNYKGYLVVILFNGKFRKTFSAHRLVAEAFIPNPLNLPQINHRDENKLNNYVDNLEWCDAKYNSNYGSRNNRISSIQFNGKKSKKVRLIELNIVFPSLAEAFRKTNIGNICRCLKGKCPKAGCFHWEYV